MRWPLWQQLSSSLSCNDHAPRPSPERGEILGSSRPKSGGTNDVRIEHRAHTSFEDAVDRTTKAVAAQGFGVLTTIDVKPR